MKQLSILLFILSFALSGCAWFSDEDETLGWSAQKLFAEATDNMANGNYAHAVELYEKLESRYPFGRYAMQSQLNMAYCFFKKGEPEPALAAIERFEKLYPDHSALAYALYLKGLVRFEQNIGFFTRWMPTDASQRNPQTTLQAFNDFAELIRKFPDTEYARDAHLRMNYLRNNLARYEIHVARYYIDRGAYLAAVNRANYVLENYQGTTSVKDAMVILVICYNKLGMPDLYEDAVRVLALNEQNGLFVDEQGKGDQSLIEDIWDYLEMDKN